MRCDIRTDLQTSSVQTGRSSLLSQRHVVITLSGNRLWNTRQSVAADQPQVLWSCRFCALYVQLHFWSGVGLSELCRQRRSCHLWCNCSGIWWDSSSSSLPSCCIAFSLCFTDNFDVSRRQKGTDKRWPTSVPQGTSLRNLIWESLTTAEANVSDNLILVLSLHFVHTQMPKTLITLQRIERTSLSLRSIFSVCLYTVGEVTLKASFLQSSSFLTLGEN